MSEDSRLLSTVCPCGKGKILWKRSEDFFDQSGPYFDSIDCPFCSIGMHVESTLSCLRSHNSTSYYLVPDTIAHMEQPNKPTSKNFIEHMVHLYSLNDLNRILDELSRCKTIQDMKKERLLAAISEQHHIYEGTRKVTAIRQNVQKAVDTYNDYEDNYDRFMEKIRIYRDYQKKILDECTLLEPPTQS